jgi:hypothetical protein
MYSTSICWKASHVRWVWCGPVYRWSFSYPPSRYQRSWGIPATLFVSNRPLSYDQRDDFYASHPHSADRARRPFRVRRPGVSSGETLSIDHDWVSSGSRDWDRGSWSKGWRVCDVSYNIDRRRSRTWKLLVNTSISLYVNIINLFTLTRNRSFNPSRRRDLDGRVCHLHVERINVTQSLEDWW